MAQNQIALATNESVTRGSVVWPGGAGKFTAEATWGGGTVQLQVLSANQTWLSVGVDTTLSANGVAGFLLPAGSAIRASITTATAVYAYVEPL